MNTDKLAEELHNILIEDILGRYDNIDYWDPELIESFFVEHGIKDESVRDKIIESIK